MDPKMIKRIVGESGREDLLEILSERLTNPDFNSLLLEVFGRRAKRMSPHDLLKSYEQNPLVKPGKNDPRDMLKIEAAAYDLLPSGFEPVELSPICPLGTCSAVAPVSQNIILSALRQTEVVSDSTNVMALECARRRRDLVKKGRLKQPVKLCACDSLLRTQRFEEEYYNAHFKVFSLVTAGQDEGNGLFEIDGLKEHIRFYLRFLLKIVARTDGLEFFVALTDIGGAATSLLDDGVLAPLKKEFPGVRFVLDPERTKARNYYERICLRIGGRDEGILYDYIADGGFVDWSKKLLSNNKERLLTSGIGLTYLWNILRKRISLDFDIR